MRILLVNKFWWPKGGVELHCFAVQDMFERMGHDVIPLAMADERNVAAPTTRYFPSAVEFRGGTCTARIDVKSSAGALLDVGRLRCSPPDRVAER